jgi:hypothetical protein
MNEIMADLRLSYPNISDQLLMNVWFIDDGSIACDQIIVKAIYDLLLSKGPKYGVFLSRTKSELVFPCPRGESFIDIFPTSLKRYPTPNADILGAPIGDAQFSQRFVED